MKRTLRCSARVLQWFLASAMFGQDALTSFQEPDRVVVTGSLIPTAEEVTATPVDTLGRREIDRSGSVQILIRVGSDDLLVGVLREEEGQLIGWSTFRPPYRYTASVRCEGPAVVLRVPATVFNELFEQDPAFAYATLSRVAVSVANRYEDARDLLHLPPRQGPVDGGVP